MTYKMKAWPHRCRCRPHYHSIVFKATSDRRFHYCFVAFNYLILIRILLKRNYSNYQKWKFPLDWAPIRLLLLFLINFRTQLFDDFDVFSSIESNRKSMDLSFTNIAFCEIHFLWIVNFPMKFFSHLNDSLIYKLNPESFRNSHFSQSINFSAILANFLKIIPK